MGGIWFALALITFGLVTATIAVSVPDAAAVIASLVGLLISVFGLYGLLIEIGEKMEPKDGSR